MKYLLITILSCAMVMTLVAQNRAASPTATFNQKVGLTDISVTYSRPSVKDRTIFADDGLVPFGKIWRTGANSASKITFSDDVEINGTPLPKGSYAILTIPTADAWTVNFYPYDQSRWSSYTEATPAASVQASPSTMDTKVESFLIAIDHLSDYGAHLVIAWDHTSVSLPFKVK